MRGCLFVLLLGAAVVIGGVLFGGPSVVGGATTVVLSLAGFSGSDTTVDVETEPRYELLRLHADQMRIRSRDAQFRDLRIADVDVTLEDVDLGARTFERIDGALEGVLMLRENAADIRIERIAITGPDPEPTVRVTLVAAEVELLATDAIESAIGQRPTSVTLEAPDRLVFTVGGVAAGGRLSVDEAGGLVLDPAIDILPRTDVFRPDSRTAFRLQSFEIEAGNLVLVGRLDLG